MRTNPPALPLVSLAFLTAYGALRSYFAFAPTLGWPTPLGLLHFITPCLVLFALLHAGWFLGWRHAFVFWMISFTVSLAFESAGVLTGLVYGPYHYTHIFGPKLFGLVPFIIPLAWFMMLYPAHYLTNMLAGEGRSRWRDILWLSLVGAMAMTAWDLAVDPAMVQRGAWVWDRPGAYFGIPLQNFAGWLVTTLTVFALYRAFEKHWPAHPASRQWLAHLPLAAYALTWLGETSDGLLNLQQPAVGLIVFFAMGSFVLAAVTRLANA